MIDIDKSRLNVADRDVPMVEGLADYAQAVFMVRPLFSFSVASSNSFCNEYSSDGTRIKKINGLDVLQNGEVVGAISIKTRYRGGEKEVVFGAESFRIQKDRGERNTTYSKDLKVILRVIKKTFIPRADDELKELLAARVGNEMDSLKSTAKAHVRWSIDYAEEAEFYARMAYEARKRGEDKVSLPSRLISVKDMNELDKRSEALSIVSELYDAHAANLGYRVLRREDGTYVLHSLETDTIQKVESFDELPLLVQHKIAVFKLLDFREAIPFGAKFDSGFYYIAPDKK